MTIALPAVRVGEPVRYKALSVFPLFVDANAGVAYRLSYAAIADQSVVVQEVSEGGSVPELLVENKGDTSVLFLEGEELVGAKQNRILNTSVLIAAGSKVRIPVSCVERGRWSYKTRRFGSSGSCSSSSLRYLLKKSVSASALAGSGHRSDQGEVWAEVDKLLGRHGVASASAAMSDAFDTYQQDLSDYRKQLPYVEGANGLAVAVGKTVVGLDLFDKPETCEKVWDRLLSGCILDALASEDDDHASVEDVEQVIHSSNQASWKRVEPVGDGEEYRADFDEDHASALTLDGVLVHESIAAR